MRKQKPPPKLFLISVTLFWLVCMMLGMTSLWSYEGSAGAAGHPPTQWPRPAEIGLDPARPTLIMLVHPQCPCSRASLYELDHLAALCPNRAAMSVLFLKPAGYPQSWVDTDLWRLASAIPGVSVRVDDHGDIARRFRAATSGETVLYAPDGRLLYQGGLTGARGHEGDNSGLSAVEALLRGQVKGARQEPVYGCPLTASRQKISLGQKIRMGEFTWLP